MIKYGRIFNGMTLIIMTFLLLVFSSVAVAGMYWVSPTGNASWTAAQSETPLSGKACCQLSTANINASAGDLVYLRAGTYNTQIAPSHSGTDSTHRITYQAYNGETVTLTNVGAIKDAIFLDGNDYIKVDGITLTEAYGWINIRNGSDYNEIANCTCISSTGFIEDKGLKIWGQCSSGSTYNCPSTNNWVHDCTFTRAGAVDVAPDCQDLYGLVYIGSITGSPPDADNTSNYNTVEDCTIYWGGHHCMEVDTRYNVIRNNFFHNEGWMTNPGNCCKIGETCPTPTPYTCGDPVTGKFGNRCLMVKDSEQTGESYYTLIENNRLGNAGLPPDGNGADNLTLGGKNIIARYNTIYNAMELGIYFRVTTATPVGIHTYNNTVYHNGQGPDCRNDNFPGFWRGGIRCNTTGTIDDVIKNTIAYQNPATPDRGDINTNNSVNITLANNWVTADGDPKFTDTDVSDPTSTTKPNLSLQSNSGCIDHGTYLTQANGSGSSSTKLVVDDAWYFQDGSWGSSLSNIQADWIAIGTVSNVVEIRSIDYSSDIITLASPMTWSDNSKVWLYKDSSGSRVLYGSGPDIGAHEFQSGGTPPATVKNLGVVP